MEIAMRGTPRSARPNNLFIIDAPSMNEYERRTAGARGEQTTRSIDASHPRFVGDPLEIPWSNT
jgi:hypothetical protein